MIRAIVAALIALNIGGGLAGIYFFCKCRTWRTIAMDNAHERSRLAWQLKESKDIVAMLRAKIQGRDSHGRFTKKAASL